MPTARARPWPAAPNLKPAAAAARTIAVVVRRPEWTIAMPRSSTHRASARSDCHDCNHRRAPDAGTPRRAGQPAGRAAGMLAGPVWTRPRATGQDCRSPTRSATTKATIETPGPEEFREPTLKPWPQPARPQIHPTADATKAALAVDQLQTCRGLARCVPRPESGRPQGNDQRTAVRVGLRAWPFPASVIPS